MSRTIRHDGTEISVELIEPLDGGARLDLEHPDGRRWRVDVTHDGEIDQLVTTWREDQIDEVALPEWVHAHISRMATV